MNMTWLKGSHGKLYQLWVTGTGVWNKPPPGETDPVHPDWQARKIEDLWGRLLGESDPPYPPIPRGYSLLPGAPIAVHRHTDNTLTALTVDYYGALNKIRIGNKHPSKLQLDVNQERISFNKLFPAGAGIAAAQQLDNQATALAVGNDGAMYVSWAF